MKNPFDDDMESSNFASNSAPLVESTRMGMKFGHVSHSFSEFEMVLFINDTYLACGKGNELKYTKTEDFLYGVKQEQKSGGKKND